MSLPNELPLLDASALPKIVPLQVKDSKVWRSEGDLENNRGKFANELDWCCDFNWDENKITVLALLLEERLATVNSILDQHTKAIRDVQQAFNGLIPNLPKDGRYLEEQVKGLSEAIKRLSATKPK